MSLTQSNSNPTEIIQISSLFAISIGLEMFNKLWEWRFYYSAAINALLTLYSSLLTLVTGLVWRALSGTIYRYSLLYITGVVCLPYKQSRFIGALVIVMVFMDDMFGLSVINAGITLNHIWAVVYASGDAKAPISQINCSTQDKTRYIGMVIRSYNIG